MPRDLTEPSRFRVRSLRARPGMTKMSIQLAVARAIAAALVLHEYFGDLRMADRFFGGVGQQVLLGDISDVFALRVLGEQMVKRLVLARAHLGRDRLPPFLGVVEYRIDVEHHAAERIEAVLDHLADLVFCDAYFVHVSDHLIHRLGLRQTFAYNA